MGIINGIKTSKTTVPSFSEREIVSCLQEDIEEQSVDILKLGLLVEVGADRTTVAEQPTFLSFQHKSLQEFSAAKFITMRLEGSQDVKVNVVCY